MNKPPLAIQPETYQDALQQKIAKVGERLSPFLPSPPETFASPAQHFRMRCEFRVWHQRDEKSSECYYAMFDPEHPRIPIRVDNFAIACESIAQLMHPLLEQINQREVLSKRLFQIEFLSTTTNETLVSLIYHRQLDETWIAEARQLEALFKISIIGRARKQKIVLSNDHVNETLSVANRSYRYQQCENSFTQPNAAINTTMLNWVCAYLANSDNQRNALLELYCGNGNFTLPMAQYFERVLATEISKTSIASAQHNARSNQVENIEFVRLSGEETAEALQRLRPFRRLAHLDLDDYHFDTVFVDPPRAGLDTATVQFINQFKEIIYISCNPDTLATNLETLSATHDVVHSALFDQFPYTSHCEAGVVLVKRR